jgi:hypothetical protein
MLLILTKMHPVARRFSAPGAKKDGSAIRVRRLFSVNKNETGYVFRKVTD